MSKQVEVELNSAGIQELLKSSEIQAACTEQAKKVASRAGDGFAVDSYIGKTRANAMVFAETAEANKRNMQENTLLKALGG